MVRVQRILFCAFAGACYPALAQQASSVTSLSPSTEPAPPPSGGTSVLAPSTGFLDTIKRFPLDWGPVTLRPSFSYGFTYADGVQSAPGQPQATTIHSFAANFVFALGSHWTLVYSPISSTYSSHEFHNSIGHSLSLTGSTTYNDWVLGLSQGYSFSAVPLVETGTQTAQTVYSTALSASYRFTDALSASMSLSQSINLAAGFNSSREWSTAESLNYDLSPRLTVGIGAGVGYADVETGFDSTFESLSGQVSWRTTEKLSLRGSVGVEFRQLIGAGANSLINPTFGVTASYQIFEVTAISLSANRSVGTSYFVNQITESTGLQVAITQRLLQHFSASLSYGYNFSDYVSTTNGFAVARRDEGSSVSVSIGCPIRSHTSVSVSYSRSENSSSASGFKFSSSQVSFQLGYHF